MFDCSIFRNATPPLSPIPLSLKLQKVNKNGIKFSTHSICTSIRFFASKFATVFAPPFPIQLVPRLFTLRQGTNIHTYSNDVNDLCSIKALVNSLADKQSIILVLKSNVVSVLFEAKPGARILGPFGTSFIVILSLWI